MPEALTNQNGEAVWAASYDAWGTIKEEHNPDNLHQPIRLPGQYHDAETNLYYNRHRYYDPKLGNYINQDPLGLTSGEPNLTVYPRNPIQGFDPLGLWEGFIQSMPGARDRASLGMHMIQQGATAEEINLAIYGKSSGFEGALSVEGNIAGHVLLGGSGALGVTVGKERADCIPKVCVYFTSCETVGPGAAGGVGVNGAVSNAPPKTGVTF